MRACRYRTHARSSPVDPARISRLCQYSPKVFLRFYNNPYFAFQLGNHLAAYLQREAISPRPAWEVNAHRAQANEYDADDMSALNPSYSERSQTSGAIYNMDPQALLTGLLARWRRQRPKSQNVKLPRPSTRMFLSSRWPLWPSRVTFDREVGCKTESRRSIEKVRAD
jgi:hypothetical protein